MIKERTDGTVEWTDGSIGAKLGGSFKLGDDATDWATLATALVNMGLIAADTDPASLATMMTALSDMSGMLTGIVCPNGAVAGFMGQRYRDTAHGVNYINVDGATAWVVL